MSNDSALPKAVWQAGQGLKIFKNVYAEQIQQSCLDLLNRIPAEKYPVSFKRALADWCIWKYSTCSYVFSAMGKYPAKEESGEMHWGDKYAGRYYTLSAYEILSKARSKKELLAQSLQFDHVYERHWLVEQLLERAAAPCALKAKMIGCVLTREEHEALRRPGSNSGWVRYVNRHAHIVDITQPEKPVGIQRLIGAEL